MKDVARRASIGLVVTLVTVATSCGLALMADPRWIGRVVLSAAWILLLVASWLFLEAFARFDPRGLAGGSLWWGGRSLLSLPAVAFVSAVVIGGALLRSLWVHVASTPGLRTLLVIAAAVALVLVVLSVLRPEVASAEATSVRARGLTAGVNRGLLALALLVVLGVVLGPLTVGRSWRLNMLWGPPLWFVVLLPATLAGGVLVRADGGFGAPLSDMRRGLGSIVALAARVTWLEWLAWTWGNLLAMPFRSALPYELQAAIFDLRDPWTLQWLPLLAVGFWVGTFALARFAWLVSRP